MIDIGKKIFVTQSNYIPWKGYFDSIARANVFVVYDEMQYTKNDWRNRNKLKTANGAAWLTIPVKAGKLDKTINETEPVDDRWRKKHLKTIIQNYNQTPFFQPVFDFLKSIYANKELQTLSDINIAFITGICKFLDIKTKIIKSSDLILTGDKNERLISICKQLDGTVYLSSPVAKDYLEVSKFELKGLDVEFLDYSGYPEYSQLFGTFDHYVSILDLLFNEGTRTRNYMKY